MHELYVLQKKMRRLNIFLSTFIVACSIAFFPYYMNWLVTFGYNTTFSVHYLSGLSRMSNWAGLYELETKFSSKARFIHDGLAEFQIICSSRTEVEAILSFMDDNWFNYTDGYSTLTEVDNTITVTTKKTHKESFRDAIIEAQFEYLK